jgi:hypothetical protein
MKQTVLYHHLKNYIIPLSIEYDTLIAFRLDEEDITIWMDGQITNKYSDSRGWKNILKY